MPCLGCLHIVCGLDDWVIAEQSFITQNTTITCVVCRDVNIDMKYDLNG